MKEMWIGVESTNNEKKTMKKQKKLDEWKIGQACTYRTYSL